MDESYGIQPYDKTFHYISAKEGAVLNLINLLLFNSYIHDKNKLTNNTTCRSRIGSRILRLAHAKRGGHKCFARQRATSEHS
jgi:hypothetical protein